MKKVEIIQAYEKMNLWLKSLYQIDDKQWFSPIDKGKWPVAAIISHLLFWDRFSLEDRFPFMKEKAALPEFPDFEIVNKNAGEYAKSGISKKKLLDELIELRMEFLTLIHSYSEQNLDISFSIGDHELTIREYLTEFIQHDLHHKNQVQTFLESLSKY